MAGSTRGNNPRTLKLNLGAWNVTHSRVFPSVQNMYSSPPSEIACVVLEFLEAIDIMRMLSIPKLFICSKRSEASYSAICRAGRIKHVEITTHSKQAARKTHGIY